MTEAYERYWTPALIRSFESFVDDLSNWYIRRSRRRFWDGDEVALWTLWHALVRSVQTIAPVMPFLADFLWRTLRADDAPESVFLRALARGASTGRGLCSPRSRRCGASSSSAVRLAATRD